MIRTLFWLVGSPQWFHSSHLQGVDFQSILDDIRKLKIIVKGHERRIKQLEEKVTFYEGQRNDSHI